MSFSFCTLFDKGYLVRGLVMIESLQRVWKDVKIYVLCMDDESLRVMANEALVGVELISMKEFEDEELLRVKPGRTRAEYCWTCTASLIRFVLEDRGQENCTYLDADLYFYRSPEPLLQSLIDDSVLLTDHNYSRSYDQTITSGRFCVQFVFIRNDPEGLKAVKWWRDRCIEWCFARHEDGKFGDQKYLDDWPTRFQGVQVCQDPGYGVAPWNIQKFTESWLNANMVFFHFHGVSFINRQLIHLDSYLLGKKKRDRFFKGYVRTLVEKSDLLDNKYGKQNWLLLRPEKKNLRSVLAAIWHTFKGTRNRVVLG